MKNKKSNKLPKFKYGGDWKKDLGEYAGNTGAGLLDIAATTVGMPNVADKLYTGNSANQFQTVAGGIGQVSAAAAPMVANAFIPGSGAAIKAGQTGLGAVDKGITQNNQAIDPQTGRPYTNQGDIMGKNIGSLGASVVPMIMARNGGIMKYDGGGKVSQTDTFSIAANNGKLDIKNAAAGLGFNYKSGDWNNPNSLIFTKDGKDYGYGMSDKGSIMYGAISPDNKVAPVSFPKTGIIKKEDPWISMGQLPSGEGYFRKGNARGADANVRYTYVNGQYVPMMANGGKMLPEAGITSNQHVYENYKTKTNGMMVYANGGIKSNITQVDGPSHENGGVKVSTPNGQYEVEKEEVIQRQSGQDRILSDKLRLPGSRKTIAEEFKPYEKLSKIINNDKLPENVRNSAKVKQEQIFNRFFQSQEELKQNKLKNYAKRLGINTDPQLSLGGTMKYTNGGFKPIVDDREMPSQYDQRSGGDPTEYLNQSPYQPNTVALDVYNKSLSDGLSQFKPNNTPISTESNNGPNWGAIGTQLGLGLANNIGNIYDLKRANDVEKIGYNKVTPQKVDPTAALRYNDAQARSFNEALRNSSVGNSSTYIQNRKDAGIQQMYANDQIRQQYANQNAQIQNQANYYNAGIGDKEIETNMMNRAQARNIKSNAYANIGQNAMGQYGDYKKGQRDQQMLKILPEIYNDPKFKEFLAKNYNV